MLTTRTRLSPLSAGNEYVMFCVMVSLLLLSTDYGGEVWFSLAGPRELATAAVGE